MSLFPAQGPNPVGPPARGPPARLTCRNGNRGGPRRGLCPAVCAVRSSTETDARHQLFCCSLWCACGRGSAVVSIHHSSCVSIRRTRPSVSSRSVLRQDMRTPAPRDPENPLHAQQDMPTSAGHNLRHFLSGARRWRRIETSTRAGAGSLGTRGRSRRGGGMADDGMEGGVLVVQSSGPSLDGGCGTGRGTGSPANQAPFY
jgi:hypothetical protein